MAELMMTHLPSKYERDVDKWNQRDLIRLWVTVALGAISGVGIYFSMLAR